MKIFFIIPLITFLIMIFDFIWLKFIAGDFFLSETKNIARLNPKGQFDIIAWAAVIVWIVMSIGLYFFVIKNSLSIYQAFTYGLLFGFILYAVFDFTNYSFIKEYSFKFLIVDILWGTFLCGSVSAITYYIYKYFWF